MSESELGKITPIRKYKTTDGQIFDDYEDAINHQEELNKPKIEDPIKKTLWKRFVDFLKSDEPLDRYF